MIYSNLEELPFHPKIKNYLLKSIRAEEHHHAYLFYGSSGSGKKAVALTFARHFICTVNKMQPCMTCPSCIKYNNLQHPDLKILAPVNKKSDNADPDSLEKAIESLKKNEFHPFPKFPSKAYYVESIRQLKSDSKFSGTEAPYKVLMLFDIEFMNPSSANAFLKLLEEPPARTIILMTTNNIHKILPTITSRCLKMQIPLPSDEAIIEVLNKSNIKLENKLIISLANNSISKAIEIHESVNESDRKNLLDFLRYSIALKPIEINTIVQKITSSKSKETIDLFLIMLQLWFRDANILLQNDKNTTIINNDFENELVKFTSKYKSINFMEIDEIIEDTRKQIYSNANATMQLVALSIQINSNI